MTLIETRALKPFYGDFQTLFGVDIVLDEGETIAILGAPYCLACRRHGGRSGSGLRRVLNAILNK